MKSALRRTDSPLMLAAAALSTETWIAIGAIIAAVILASLRVVGYDYYNAVLWHNLRIQVQRMRQAQADQVRQLADHEAAAAVAVVESAPEEETPSAAA